MSEYIIILIEYFRHYHLWILGGLIVLQNNGIPVGANFLVMASGAFAYAGEFNLYSLVGQVWLFSLMGDSLSYCIWRKAGVRALSRFPRMERRLAPGLLRAESYFDRYGKMTVAFTRFPLSALGPVINISAGLSGYRYLLFLVPAALGEMLWVGFNLGLGYWFGDGWEQIALLVSRFGRLILLLIILLVVIYAAVVLVKNQYRLTRDRADRNI